MTRRLAELYPFLFAVLPVLYLAERFPGKAGIPNLLVVLAALVAIFGLIYLAAGLALGRRAGSRLAAPVTMLAVVWTYGVPFTGRWLPAGPKLPGFIVVGALPLVLGGVAIYLLSRRPRLLDTGAAFLTIAGTILVVRFAADITLTSFRERNTAQESALGRALSEPIEAPEPPPGPRRDIYLLVLDEYANADVLRERFGYDNSAFEDSLRALGFHVPDAVRSNYSHTLISLPSLLNSAHVHAIAQEPPEARSSPVVVNRLLERNRVAPFLQERGYRYIFFPSLWWGATQRSLIADSVVSVWSGLNPLRDLSRTEFRRAIWKATPLRFVQTGYPWDADHVRRTLDGFSRLPEVEGPVFAFAHVLSPHWPYVLGSDCQTLPHSAHGGSAAYIPQLECINSLVLDAVRTLLRDSDVPPVILIQGDHGTSTLGFGDLTSMELVSEEVARERFGAFGAYYLPDSGAAAFGDSVTIVNVMGNVLRHYFGAELPREPDDRYVSLSDTPYDFRRVESPAVSSTERNPRAPRKHHVRNASTAGPARGLRSGAGAGSPRAGPAGSAGHAGGAGR